MNNLALGAALALLGGYLCGSIPFGVIFGRLRGVDLQKTGSGNIGATNAARALGKPIGVLVLLCDAGKVVGPLVLLRWWRGDADGTRALLALLAFGAVAGHMFPPWLRFHGGKGVATAFGAFAVLQPLVAGGAAVVWATLWALTRTSSIGSLVTISAVPLALWLLRAPWPDLALALALWPLIVWRHRDNIRRLLARSESRV